MKKIIFTHVVLLIFLFSCGNISKQNSNAAEAAPTDTLASDSTISPTPKQETLSYKDGNDSLLYKFKIIKPANSKFTGFIACLYFIGRNDLFQPIKRRQRYSNYCP